MFLLLIFTIIILIFLGYLDLTKKVLITSFHIKTLFIAGCIVVFVALLISFPKVSFLAATSGVNLWFNVVFPSLLPFIIASELLIGLGFVNFLGTLLEPLMRFVFNVPGAGSFALAMGLTSGYPTGAKVTTMLRENGLCTKTEGERLLTFTNNSGPLFIIGAVAVGMFNDAKLGFILALAHYSAAITVGIIFRFYKNEHQGQFLRFLQSKHKNRPLRSHFVNIDRQEPSPQSTLTKAFREMFKARRKDGRNFGLLMGDSVKNSVNLLLMVGGFIIFFSVFISILTQLKVLSGISNVLGIVLSPLGIDSDLINSILSGFFEVTTGCKLVSLTTAEYMKKAVTTAFILGWAGLSIHFQIISIVSKTDISAIPFIFAKFFQGVISGVYTYLLLSYFFLKTSDVFNNLSSYSWLKKLAISGEFFALTLLILFTLGLTAMFLKNVFSSKLKK